MSSIQDLKSVFSKRGGAARQNRFSLIVSPPASLGFNFKDLEDMNVLCENCVLPGRQITTIDYQLLEQSFKIPTGFMNEEVSFTFLLTNDFFAKEVFDRWAAAVVGFGRYKLKCRESYAGQISVFQLMPGDPTMGGLERNVSGIQLQRAFPTAVSAVTLDNAAENSVQRVTVTVAYENFVIL